MLGADWLDDRAVAECSTDTPDGHQSKQLKLN